MLVATVAAVALLPLAVLAWAGWRLREQDRILAAQQVSQRVERAADIVVAALQRSISATRQRLAAGAADWPEGAVSILWAPSRFEALPPGRLAWVPEAPALPQAPSSVIAEGEELEFRKADAKSAEVFYRNLADAPDPATRAAALIRLARVLRAQNRQADALEVYRTMDGLNQVAVEHAPASLLALHAGIELLTDQGRPHEAQTASARLRDGLRNGRWIVSQPLYEAYASAPPEPLRLTFALAAAQLHRTWKQRPPEAWGSLVLDVAGEPITVLHQSSGPEIRALLVTSAFAQAHWLPGARAAAAEQQVSLALIGAGASPSPPPRAVIRKAADASLPWATAVASLNTDAELTQIAARRRLFEASLLMLAFFTLAAAFFTIRAIRREAETARLQSDFVAAVSHEFRTPLTSLRQFTEMLRDGRPLTEARLKTCYAAQARATDRLTRLVESILDFSRLEQGAHRFSMERCDSEPLVRRMVGEFTAGGSPVLVEVDCQASAPIHADPEAVGRAIWNLLDNAVKYSPNQPGSVRVTVDRREGHAAIAVRDCGLGIPRHEQQAIFHRFRRGAQAVTLGIKGTGIGLAMVDQIVRAHHGRIDLESEPGQGSTFTILLPIRE